MLARLHRALAFAPSRFARQLSTTPPTHRFIPDDLLITESSGPSPSSSQPPESTQPKPSNGLSYADLPANQVVLNIPPEQDPLLRYLTSLLQQDGRRHTAERHTARVLLYLHTLTRAEPLALLYRAVERVAPSVSIVRHRLPTRDNNIPVALSEKQKVRFAIKWMLKASDSRGGRTVEERLAREVMQVLNGNSSALKQKETLHQLAMVNRGNIPASRRVF